MTDLQVVQPVFTLVLYSIFRLRTTAHPAIVGWGMGHSGLSHNAFQTTGGIVDSKGSEQTNQSVSMIRHCDHKEGQLDSL